MARYDVNTTTMGVLLDDPDVAKKIYDAVVQEFSAFFSTDASDVVVGTPERLIVGGSATSAFRDLRGMFLPDGWLRRYS